MSEATSGRPHAEANPCSTRISVDLRAGRVARHLGFDASRLLYEKEYVESMSSEMLLLCGVSIVKSLLQTTVL